MANVKWSGIESTKYGLTATWYVSAQYGSDTDVDGVGLYDASTNVDGWGGPTRPFKSIEQAFTNSATYDVIVLDSGYYATTTSTTSRKLIGDGNVIITNTDTNGGNGYFRGYLYNISVVSSAITLCYYEDCLIIYSDLNSILGSGTTVFIECTPNTISGNITNTCFLRCSGGVSGVITTFINNFLLDSEDLYLQTPTPRSTGVIMDYSIIIGSVKTSVAINGKTTGVTIEDFKIDGNYFGKSYSEVDLWGNAEGSGATTIQIQEIFNNYLSPVYLDNWQYLDLSLKSTVDDRIKYGGLSGNFIGALSVGHSYDISTLWNTYQDSGNTSNVEVDGVSGNLVLSSGQTSGVFTSTEITLPEAIVADVSMFFKNNVYNSDGVAVQRLDTTLDDAVSNTTEQRTVYSYRLKTSVDDGTALGVWKEYELDKAPTVDASGNSNVNDSFDSTTETTQTIKKFAIEVTLRDIS